MPDRVTIIIQFMKYVHAMCVSGDRGGSDAVKLMSTACSVTTYVGNILTGEEVD